MKHKNEKKKEEKKKKKIKVDMDGLIKDLRRNAMAAFENLLTRQFFQS